MRIRIIDAVRDATGRELTLSGDVSVRLLPSARFHAAGVAFANAPWATTPSMAQVKSIDVELRLLPLLSGRIEVARLLLTEPDIALETGPDGNGNWVFDKPAPQAAKGPAQPPASTRSAAISLPDVRIEGGRAVFRDFEGTRRLLQAAQFDRRRSRASRRRPKGFCQIVIGRPARRDFFGERADLGIEGVKLRLGDRDGAAQASRVAAEPDRNRRFTHRVLREKPRSLGRGGIADAARRFLLAISAGVSIFEE